MRSSFHVQTIDTAQGEEGQHRGAIAPPGTEGKMKGSVLLVSEKRVCTGFETAPTAKSACRHPS